MTPYHLGFSVVQCLLQSPHSFSPMLRMSVASTTAPFNIQVDCLQTIEGVEQIQAANCSDEAISVVVTPNIAGAALAGSGVFNGIATVNAFNGIAQFQNPTITKAGSYTLTAVIGNKVALPATSPPITVGSAAMLTVTDNASGVTYPVAPPAPSGNPPPASFTPGPSPVDVGDPMSVAGSGWDPNGGPGQLTWDLQEGQVTQSVDVAPDGTISIPVAPMHSLHRTAWSFNGTPAPACSAGVTAAQGNVSANVLLTGSSTFFLTGAGVADSTTTLSNGQQVPAGFGITAAPGGEQVVAVDGDVTAGLGSNGPFRSRSHPREWPSTSAPARSRASTGSRCRARPCSRPSRRADVGAVPRVGRRERDSERSRHGPRRRRLAAGDPVQLRRHGVPAGPGGGNQHPGRLRVPFGYTYVALPGGRFVTLGRVGGTDVAVAPISPSCAASPSGGAVFDAQGVSAPQQPPNPWTSPAPVTGTHLYAGNLTVSGGLTLLPDSTLAVTGNLLVTGGLTGQGAIQCNGSVSVYGPVNLQAASVASIQASRGRPLRHHGVGVAPV
ncbi:MAG: hypothetical protein ACYDEN_01465, partial [Acidimicrobiales bacterium]